MHRHVKSPPYVDGVSPRNSPTCAFPPCHTSDRPSTFATATVATSLWFEDVGALRATPFRHLAKVDVEGSNPFSRSTRRRSAQSPSGVTALCIVERS